MASLRALRDRLLDRFRRADPWTRVFVAVFALLCACALYPIWRVRFLPLLDEPNHVAAIYIWHHLGDPAARLREFYDLNIELVPYFIHYTLAHLFAYVVGVEAGHKLVLSLYVLALPTAGLLWCRRTGRSPWLAVLVFPLTYSYAWSQGFHAFNLGLAASLFALAAVDGYLERPTPARAAAVALLGFACYLGHPLAFFTLGLGTFLLWFTRRPRPLRLLGTAAALLPGAALVAYQLWRPKAHQWTSSRGPLLDGVFLKWREMVGRWPRYVLDSVSGDADLVVLWVLVGVVGLLLLAGVVTRFARVRASGDWGDLWRRARPLRDHRAAVLFAAFTACYFFIPLHLTRPFDWWFVAGRFAPLTCFFAFLLPATSLAGWRALLVAPAVVAAVFLPLHLAGKYVAFNERARPFVRMVERTRPGANVLFLGMQPRGDQAVNVHAYNQFASWVQVLHGGYSASGWEPQVPFPYRIKKKLPAPPWNRQEAFRPALHAAPYDYVIVRNERYPIFAPPSPAWRVVAHEGVWKLYERVRR